MPPKLAVFFQDKGVDAIHTTHFPDGHLLKDKEIRQIATVEDRIVITKDSDFLDYFLLKGIPPKVLLLEMGNISNANLKKQLRPTIFLKIAHPSC